MLLINQPLPASVLLRALSPPILWPGGAFASQAQVQHLALGCIELCEVHPGSPLQPVRVPVDDIPSLQHIGHTSELHVIDRLAENVFNPCPQQRF